MIPYGRHSIGIRDIISVINSLKSDWLTTGPRVKQFENLLSEFVGAPCVTVTSGTAALHCAYAAIGLQENDEIITPPITFVATQATARMFGAKIVFADVQPDTLNIDPKYAEKVISKRTKAIVAVDYAGHPADLKELRKIADKHSIFLIEDAAHSLGSIYRGQPVGSIADITTFSFFPTKNITTAEGGAIASIHPHLLEKAKRFSRQGLIRDSGEFIIKDEGAWHQEVHEFGLNYRLPDVLCALGISQIAKLEEFKEKRRAIFQYYAENLKDLNITLPQERSYVDSNWHLYPVRVQASKRRDTFDFLRSSGIGVQVNYLPAYRHPAFGINESVWRKFTNSERFYKEEISLPMHPRLRKRDLEKVVRTLKAAKL
jgi:dTDP-4-amino-4,6-dideoxygalactose transaminase